MITYLTLTAVFFSFAAWEFFTEEPRTKEGKIRGVVALAIAAWGFCLAFSL